MSYWHKAATLQLSRGTIAHRFPAQHFSSSESGTSSVAHRRLTCNIKNGGAGNPPSPDTPRHGPLLHSERFVLRLNHRSVLQQGRLSGSDFFCFLRQPTGSMSCLAVMLNCQVKPMLFNFVRRGAVKLTNVPVRPAPGLFNGPIKHPRYVVHSALHVVRSRPTMRPSDFVRARRFTGHAPVALRRVCEKSGRRPAEATEWPRPG